MQISRWQMKEDLRLINRRVGSGALATYEIAEELLKKWIFNQRERRICVTPCDIKSYMKQLLATDAWFNCFLNRHNLSLRRRTKISLRLA